MTQLLTEPALRFTDATGLWTVLEALHVQTRAHHVVVPAGFQSDLASIPRLFWSLACPFELGIAGPIVHDWLYEHSGAIQAADGTTAVFTRHEADEILLDLMARAGVPAWRRYPAFAAVRLVGKFVWRTTGAAAAA